MFLLYIAIISTLLASTFWKISRFLEEKKVDSFKRFTISRLNNIYLFVFVYLFMHLYISLFKASEQYFWLFPVDVFTIQNNHFFLYMLSLLSLSFHLYRKHTLMKNNNNWFVSLLGSTWLYWLDKNTLKTVLIGNIAIQNNCFVLLYFNYSLDGKAKFPVVFSAPRSFRTHF